MSEEEAVHALMALRLKMEADHSEVLYHRGVVAARMSRYKDPADNLVYARLSGRLSSINEVLRLLAPD